MNVWEMPPNGERIIVFTRNVLESSNVKGMSFVASFRGMCLFFRYDSDTEE